MKSSCLLLAAITCALALPAAAQDSAASPAVTAQPVTIGESLQIYSDVLSQERNISAYLPNGYHDEIDRTYPVLYLIDGGLQQDFLHVSGTTMINALWGRSQSVIVIGIETIDRQSELISQTLGAEYLEAYPNAGHAEQFRRYIREEVIPLAEARYRGNGQRGVIGESLAGLFIVETALQEPELFQRHAAISPSLWWDDERLSRRAGALLAAQDHAPELYLTIANEGEEMEEAYQRVTRALAAKAGMGENWCSLPRHDLTHATIFHAMTPQALQFLFPAPPAEYETEGFEPPCDIGSR